MTRQHVFFTAVLCAAALGCRAEPSSPAASEARDVCLASPDAGMPADVAIRRAQDQARKLPIDPQQWTVVGQGWVRKARITADPGFYVNVRACVDAALAIAPDYRPALQLSALALMNDHDFAEARAIAERILAADPDDPMTLGIHSDALLELGDFDGAAAAAQRMVDVRPGMASYSRAAYFRWLKGDTKTAKQFMQLALNGRDDRDREPAAWTFVQAATMYWNEGDYAGADAVFAEGLKWAPDYAPALTGRGRAQLSLGHPERAVEYLEKAHRINRLPETAWLLGDARAVLGDAKGADAAYAMVVQDGQKTDRLTLALFYATKNRAPAEAVRLIEEERRTRGGVYIDDAYAWALFRAGRLDEARAASDRALRLNTRDARLWYHAGMIRLAAGDPEGRELVRRALRLNPRFDSTAASEATRALAHD